MADWVVREVPVPNELYDEAERLRAELADRENTANLLEGYPQWMHDANRIIYGVDTEEASIPSWGSDVHVGEVEPAQGDDRGTIFDRPARELERIARERDAALAEFERADEAQQEAMTAAAEVRGIDEVDWSHAEDPTDPWSPEDSARRRAELEQLLYEDDPPPE